MNVQMKTMKNLSKSAIDLSGKTFGRLKVMSAFERRQKILFWKCRCSCGVVKWVSSQHLRLARVRSCGCLHREVTSLRTKIHGESKRFNPTPEYQAWQGMKRRCYRRSDTSYNSYGGRGISVCPAWRKSYLVFLCDVGRRPSSKHSLGRINNNGNYEPNNVEWQTDFEQQSNKRNNRLITIGCITATLADWSRHYSVPIWFSHQRLKRGWSPETAFIRGAPRSVLPEDDEKEEDEKD